MGRPLSGNGERFPRGPLNGSIFPLFHFLTRSHTLDHPHFPHPSSSPPCLPPLSPVWWPRQSRPQDPRCPTSTRRNLVRDRVGHAGHARTTHVLHQEKPTLLI